MRIDHGKRFVNGKVYIKGIEGFWSFVKEWLIKYHRDNPKNFRSTSKNWNSEYNHRYHDLYGDVVKCVFDYSLVVSIQ